MMNKFFQIFLLVSVLFSCTNKPTEQGKSKAASATDSLAIMRNFMYGLWSLDNQNKLSNEGFYLLPDGILNLIASEATGNWELKGMDSIQFSYTTYKTKPLEEVFKIDSLSDDRMVLTSNDGKTVFRKVPFGANQEGIILTGFMGSIQKDTEKEYTFSLPSAKKIQIHLTCDDPHILFRLYDEEKEMTSTGVSKWEGIIIRGGKYKAKVMYSGVYSGPADGIEFNLNVIGF